MCGKQCTKCKEIKPLSEFYPRRSRKSGMGLFSCCKQCSRSQHDKWNGKYPPGSTKLCPHCKFIKQDTEFYRQPKNSNRLSTYCKVCQRKLKSQSPQQHRQNNYRTNYNISIDDYDKMLAEQNGCCAICTSNISGKRKFFAVDHDHTTNIVRGLLCDKCNLGIGQFNDSPEQLDMAARYLRKFEL